MISFTITEKGYALYRPDGSLMPVVQADIDEGPAHARHAMSMVAALLLERFQNGAYPLAVVSIGQLLPQRREAAGQRYDRCQGMAGEGLSSVRTSSTTCPMRPRSPSPGP